MNFFLFEICIKVQLHVLYVLYVLYVCMHVYMYVLYVCMYVCMTGCKSRGAG